MNTEIERKFLVNSKAFKTEAVRGTKIIQGFLNTHPQRTVRVRVKGNKGFLTVKGISNNSGLSRLEWEKEISKEDALAIMPLCEKGIISKTRYEIPVGNHIFEVDVFEGDNEGLVVAEVELKSENEPFEKPDWLGKEVTGDLKYYNSQLSKLSYKNW